MPPHHILLILLCAVGLPTLLTFFSLLHAHPRGQGATESTSENPKSGIAALFSFHTPSTLFPPSAIISLTDDNSTFFLARPADFGPSISAHGLSGQLWIGSGFGDDNLGRGGAGAGAEGELGCSDVPGWDDGTQQHRRDSAIDQTTTGQSGMEAGNNDVALMDTTSEEDEQPSEDDGTDDDLHHPLPTSPVSKPVEPGQSTQHPPAENGQSSTHADIQSLQESAEISGKIVLLSRGGCGFLEKVKWAQRRGGTALIVGDHTRGGALITMYARGDTSNVTIPSLFTSRTTAHLLSSLMPPDSLSDRPDADEVGRAPSSTREGPRNKAKNDRPTFTPSPIAKLKSTSSRNSKRNNVKPTSNNSGFKQKRKLSWLQSLASSLGLGAKTHAATRSEDSRRPPSSGRLDWFSEKWTDESSKEGEAGFKGHELVKASGKDKSKAEAISKEPQKSGLLVSSGDDFVIGVQDWRDPDLVVAKPSHSKTKSTTTIPPTARTPQASKGAGKVSDSAEQNSVNVLSGGSITPGSGEYHKPGFSQKSPTNGDSKTTVADPRKNVAAQGINLSHHIGSDDVEEHEGLWVTLTLTTMSTSPFFDTLLVLVVSPLVTLTVVYALLLLRSRIRRRRWRAPKSVVDRLPIRTYHTMSYGSTTSSTRLPSPVDSSPATPLLQSSPQAVTARSRSRSATSTGIRDAISKSLDRATAKASLTQGEKSGARVKSKKIYNGKQVECVVCLEEYVDGQSRVMSLPCGHEFHAECM